MAYTSLYRKYRPDTFENVIGQDHIVRTLKNQIANDNIGHAYVFTGTRGTGKTSVAKIFARAVNCLNPVDGSPCGKCSVCKELAFNNNFDILEIDAASNNSVEQIRELTDKINFPPTVGRYKVYIIDEFHMLSKSAHNALLKTLEEPPSHAIFILATTEIHQIPATILSRCLRFDFRLVPNSVISKRIRFIFDDIKVKYETQAVELIAAAGNGSVRDALSIADMCVSYCNGNITYQGVLEILGASDPEKLANIAFSIADGDISNALEGVSSMCDLGKSIPILASDLANFFRNALYIKNCAAAKELLALPENTFAKIKEVADKFETKRLLEILQLMSSLEGELRYSSQHRILLEAKIVVACSGEKYNTSVQDLEKKVALLEAKLASLQKGNFNKVSAKPSDARQIWKQVASELQTKGYQFLSFAAMEAEVFEDKNSFIVKVPTRATLTLLTEKNNRDVINEIFTPLSDLKLCFEEVVKLDDDKALPFIKSMFGNKLEIK